VHTEDPAKSGSAAPENRQVPALDLKGYTLTEAVPPPAGKMVWQSVLVEWTDTNVADAAFEGTARELLRVGSGFPHHPMGDLLFNPRARRGDADYRNLYISVGDGSAGQTPGPTHTIPQRLDSLLGKVLRITPDLGLRPKDKLSANGRYRIPSTGANANPFVSVSKARGEIYAYGFRNPHRMHWDAASDTLLVNDIGIRNWEEVNIVVKGGNYGFAEREGPEQVFVDEEQKTGGQMEPPRPLASPDQLQVEGLAKPVKPIYPAATYSHRDGDAIGSGFVYRGKLIPQLVGKYLFTDIPTARLFYADLKEMKESARKGSHAEIHQIEVVPRAGEGKPEQAAKKRLYDLVAETYARKGGFLSPGSKAVLPGGSRNTRPGSTDPEGAPYGGRADVRLSMGGDGEIYVLSRSDGMIRRLAGVVEAPASSQAQR
jgi:hypothetical protein